MPLSGTESKEDPHPRGGAHYVQEAQLESQASRRVSSDDLRKAHTLEVEEAGRRRGLTMQESPREPSITLPHEGCHERHPPHQEVPILEATEKGGSAIL